LKCDRRGGSFVALKARNWRNTGCRCKFGPAANVELSAGERREDKL
jgi:hypothetical protein